MTSSPEMVRMIFGVFGPTEFNSWTCYHKVYLPSLRSASVLTLLATEFSFNFESKMWENGEKKYDHKDLQFVTSVLTTGIEPGSNQECRQNLKDIIGFIRGWRNDEQLSMHFLSSDESDGCKNDSFVTASTLKPGAYACSSKDHTSRFDSRYIIKGASEYRLEFWRHHLLLCRNRFNTSFSDGETKCESLNMFLATPDLPEMNSMMRSMNLSQFWTGYRRVNQTHFYEKSSKKYASCDSNVWQSIPNKNWASKNS